jgi:hypothetical protein
MTNDRWRSVDGHFEAGAGSLSHSVLSQMVVNDVVMYNHYKSSS